MKVGIRCGKKTHSSKRCRSTSLWFAVLTVAHLASTSCASAGDILREETTDGVPVCATAGDSGQRAILVMDPGQCFACSNVLPAWMSWGSDSGRTAVLILTRRPDELERRKMRIVGIREIGVLKHQPDSGLTIRIFLSDDQTPRVAYQETDESAFTLIAELTSEKKALENSP